MRSRRRTESLVFCLKRGSSGGGADISLRSLHHQTNFFLGAQLGSSKNNFHHQDSSQKLAEKVRACSSKTLQFGSHTYNKRRRVINKMAQFRKSVTHLAN